MLSRLLAGWRRSNESVRWRDRRYFLAVSALCTSLAAPLTAASAAKPAAPPSPDVNETTVGIVTGTVTGTYVQFASDLSNVLDNPGKLRILAVLGKGSLQNVEDILRIRGIDLGIVQSDVLTYIKKQGMFPGIENQLQYVTKLYNEEFHLLVRSNIQQLEDLRGQKVNFGPRGSGIAITSSIVFDLLKIKVEATYDDPGLALEKLKRGEIAASVGVYGKPAKIYDTIKTQDNVRFLPVPPSLELSKVYFPSALTNKEYPNLIGPDERVETISVGAVMVVFGWEPNTWRYNKVARFIDAFFSNLEQLQKPPRHQKWQEVNLGAKVPGWVRFPAAEEWVKRAAVSNSTGKSSTNSELTSFRRFPAETSPNSKESPMDEDARLQLFQAFEAWRKTQGRQ